MGRRSWTKRTVFAIRFALSGCFRRIVTVVATRAPTNQGSSILSKTARISNWSRIHAWRRKPYSTSSHWLEVSRQSRPSSFRKLAAWGQK